MRESVRTQDLSHEGLTAFMTCRHSSTAEYRYLNACVLALHVALNWGVALVGDISTGFCSPHRGTTFSGTQEDSAPSRP